MNRKTWPTSPAEELAFKDWQYEVANGDTVLGFREWLAQQYRPMSPKAAPKAAD